jgi:hypothetical protein
LVTVIGAAVLTFCFAWKAAAKQQESVQKPAEPTLEIVEQKRGSPDAASVMLKYSALAEGSKKVQAQIVWNSVDWRFRKAQAVPGSGIAVSVKQQREKDNTVAGGSIMVLVLTISSNKEPLPLGAGAEIFFTNTGRDPSAPLGLRLRKVDVGTPDPLTAPPLEPPTAEPPRNPAPTCFFFTH